MFSRAIGIAAVCFSISMDASAWSLHERKDEMRGGANYLATQKASNGPGYLAIGQSRSKSLAVYVGVLSGQGFPFLTRQNTVKIKFDNEAIIDWSCSGESLGRTCFFYNTHALACRIRDAKRLIVEAPGGRQFVFDFDTPVPAQVLSDHPCQ